MRGAGAGHVEQAVVDGLLILRELHVGHVEAFLRQTGEGPLFRVVIEKTLICAAGIGAAVPPPGELVDDLVVLIFLFCVLVGLDELFVALVEFFKARKGRADNEQVTARQGMDGGPGNGEGEGKFRLAAVERDSIIAALERGFFFTLAVGRKEDGVLVKIAEGCFLSAAGQRADDAVFERVEAGVVAVLVFLCLAYGEAGAAPLGGEGHVRKRADRAKIVDGDRFHKRKTPFIGRADGGAHLMKTSYHSGGNIAMRRKNRRSIQKNIC